MAKKKKDEVLEESVNQPEEEYVPEIIEEGITKEEKKQDPMDLVNKAVKVRCKGNWKKVSYGEMQRLQEEGLLVGYDPKTGEVLTK